MLLMHLMLEIFSFMRWFRFFDTSTPTRCSEAAEGTENLEHLQRLLENVLDSLSHYVWAKSAPHEMERKQLLGE